jgi:hypothetical protein
VNYIILADCYATLRHFMKKFEKKKLSKKFDKKNLEYACEFFFGGPAKVGVLRASHKIFLSLTGKFE